MNTQTSTTYTVSELIKALKECPKDYTVLLYTPKHPDYDKSEAMDTVSINHAKKEVVLYSNIF